MRQFLADEWRSNTSRTCLHCQQDSKFAALPVDQQQLLQSVAENYNCTLNSRQSDEFKLALSECIESGMEHEDIALYVRMNVNIDGRLYWPYGRDSDYKRVMSRINGATRSKPLLTDVKPGRERTPVERTVAETTLNQRLQEADSEKQSVPFYRNQTVHCLPLDSLPSRGSINIHDTDGRHGDLRRRVKDQVSHEIPDDLLARINTLIADMDDPEHRMNAFQESLREEFGVGFFFFKGVVYFMQMLGPPEVKRELKKISKALFERLFAEKNGCSSEDLQLFVRKLGEMLSFVPSEYLRVFAVGIPFGLCISRELESVCHLLQSSSRIHGELFDELDLAVILAHLESVGCRIVADGKIGRVPGKHGGSPISVRDGVAGTCYIARAEYVPNQSKILCELYGRIESVSDEARRFVINILLHKMGMATGRGNISRRTQKFQWCSAAMGVAFYEILTANARKLEMYLHKLASGQHKFGERFQLETIVDGQVDSSAFAELKNKLEEEDYVLTPRTLEREWKPFTWSLRFIKRALRVGILKKEQIIDLIASGHLQFCSAPSRRRIRA